MQISKNYSLKQENTFGIESEAEFFVVLDSLEEVQEFFGSRDMSLPIFFLSWGSNVVLPSRIPGYTVRVNIQGKKTQEQWDDILVYVGAGENWHEFVQWSVGEGYGGIENLALIPGNVGTSPIQNIGAYGVQVEDVIEEVRAVDVYTGELKSFTNKECGFGYRDSIFKQKNMLHLCIVGVWFRLSRNSQMNTSYGAISKILAEKNIQNPSYQDVMNTVISIRQSKLPDPRKVGNVGSVFKNPIISSDQFRHLSSIHSDMPYYMLSESTYKIPAAWLIDRLGLKGKNIGKIGIHQDQPLVLFNFQQATQEDFIQAVQYIQGEVYTTFSIHLEPEVRII